MNARHRFPSLAAAILFALTALGGGCASTATAPVEEAFSVRDLSGATTALDLRARPRPSVLVFSADWCEPCSRQAPGLRRLARELGDRVAFVEVLVDTELDSARSYVQRHRIDYEAVWDPSLSMADRYGVDRVPMIVLVDRRGAMIARDSELTERLRTSIVDAGAPEESVSDGAPR